MRILLVRLRLIGDVVFTTPLIRALRRRYPDAHLSYVVEPAAAPIVQGNPHLDQVVVVPRGCGMARLRHDLVAATRLRRLRPDVAIDLHGGPRGAWLTWLSGAPMRIGYRIQGRTWMYTHRVPRTRPARPRHSVLDQWDLLGPLDIPPGTPADDPLEMAPDPAAADRIESRLRAASIDPASLVVMHVSASNRFKRWPAEAFETLIVRLVRADPARRIYLTAGPSDTSATRRIAAAARQQLGPLADAVPDLPDFDLAELRALVARAALYVGGDSGPLHVAATTGVPILAILGPTLPERTRPWRDPARPAAMVDAGPLPCRPCDQRRCEPGDFRCLTRVSPDRVAAEAEALLAAGAGRFAPPVSCPAGG
jgi:lipopolysaccharide heptosyltransferase II